MGGGVLAHQLQLFFAVRGDEGDDIGVHAEAGSGGAEGIGADHVGVLAGELLPGVFDDVVRLHREAAEELSLALVCAQVFENVLGALQLDGKLAVLLFHLGIGDRGRGVVADGGGLDDDVHVIGPGGDGLEHILGILHGDHVDEHGGLCLHVGGDQGHIRAPVMLQMRASGRDKVQDYADKFGVPFFPGEKPWGVKADVIMPSAMQNDVNMEQAKRIAANDVKYYIEVANMPTTNDALFFLMEQPGMIVAPSKAVNAGGVGVSGLEMSQNSERLVWTAEEVDAQLHKMMINIHKVSAEAAEEYGLGYNLVAGANLAGFKKVAEAMMEQGIF